MAKKIQLRRDTQANWEATNPILAQGEKGLELDTGKEKVGDGETAWNNLDYWNEGGTGGISMTDREIRDAYERNLDRNAYTDAEKTKLSNVEDFATADQSPSEIKLAYEDNTDTNAFTDAEKTKLTGIEANATSDNKASIQTKRPLKTINGNSIESSTSNGGENLEIVASVTTAAVQAARPLKDINGLSLEGTGNIDLSGGAAQIQVETIEQLRELDTSSYEDGTKVEVLAHNAGGFDVWDILNIVDAETVYDITAGNLIVQPVDTVDAVNVGDNTIEVLTVPNEMYVGAIMYNPSLEVIGTIKSINTVFSPTRRIIEFEEPLANISVGQECYYSETDVIGNENKIVKATSDNKTYSYNAATKTFLPITPTAWSSNNVSYTKGDIHTYVNPTNNETYYVKCNYSHTSKSYYAPNTSNYNRSDVWEVTTDATTVAAWNSGVEYTANDVTSRDGINYKALRTHVSVAGYEPSILIEKYQDILSKRLGGGTFIFRKNPEFTATTNFSFTTLDNGGYSISTNAFTPAKRSYPKGEQVGQSFITTNGTIVKILRGGNDDIVNFNGQEYPKSAIATLLKGDTSFTLTAFAYADKETINNELPNNLTSRPTISNGDDFYLLDDNGTVINAFDGGNVVGTFERLIPNGYVNFEMYGATPHPHPYVFELYPEEEKISDYRAIQNALDNLYYPVKQTNGYFYTRKTVQLKVQKSVEMTFGSEGVSLALDKGWTSGTSAIFIDDPNIDVFEIKTSIQNCTINTDTSIVRGNSEAECNHVTANLRQVNLVRARNCEFNMFGSETGIHKYNRVHNGFVVDDRYRTYASDFREAENAGTFHFSDIRVRYKNVERGFWLTNTRGRATSVNGLTVKFLGCFYARQFLVLDRACSRSRFEADVWQLTDTMSWDDAVTNQRPAIKVIGGGTFLDGQMMDAGFPPDSQPVLDVNDIAGAPSNFADLTALANFINALPTSIYIFKNGGKRTRGTILKAVVAGVQEYYFSNENDGLYGLNDNQITILDGNGNYILDERLVDAIGIHRYMPNTLVELGGYGIQLGNSMQTYFKEINYGRIKNIECAHGTQNISLTNSDFIIPSTNSGFNLNGVISKLDNGMMFINRRASTYYVKAFNAGAVDLTTLTASSDGASGITEFVGAVTLPEGVVDRNAASSRNTLSSTVASFSAGSNVDTSYTEIFISANSFPVANKVSINLSAVIFPKKIQMIVLDNVGAVEYNSTRDVVVTDYRFSNLLYTFDTGDIFSGTKTLIIRIIGSNAPQGDSFTHTPTDIIAVDKVGNFQPYIHTGGGLADDFKNQSIGGDLAFSSGTGVVLRSPNGDRHRLTVSDAGVITAINIDA